MKEATRQNGNHTEHALHQEQLFIFLWLCACRVAIISVMNLDCV
jgi:hypothetical protein